MQTTEEMKAYIKQLEGEVSKWHHAYDNLMIERTELAAKVMNLETILDKVNRLFAAIPKQDSATEIDTLTSGLKKLETELAQYKEANHGN
jgi:predicted RNase H-like nuclease (RuvC/YqgF family)